MLSSNKNILETLSVLRQHGVHDFVLCPGSRNAPISHSVCQIEDFCAHTATDERSAGFMALGMALATHAPVAVVVTSGSALANLYPAACEAFYQHAPLVFISADRPAAWIGQMDGQTMPQEGALGKMVKMSVSLPEDNLWHANRLLNEAMLACKDRLPQGPVHINIPISEPVYKFNAKSLPEARVIRLRNISLWHKTPENEQDCLVLPQGRTLIVIGQLHITEQAIPFILQQVSANFRIVAENLSKTPTPDCTNPCQIDWTRMKRVDRLITLGGHIVNKELKEFFRKHKPKEHWHVSPDGAVADTFCCQTHAVVASVAEFLNYMLLCNTSKCKPLKLPLKDTGAGTADPRVDLLAELFSKLPETVNVHLANSSTVRLAQQAMTAYRNYVYPMIFCNRGINGIEGCVSTAVGFAMAVPKTERLVLVTGDLAFFYDSNALWNEALPANIGILLLNNGEGGIFRQVKGFGENPMAQGFHHATAEGICHQNGVTYVAIHNIDELYQQIERLTDEEAPIVMEVFTDAEIDKQELINIYNSFKL